MTNYDNWAEIYDELYSEYKDDLSFYQKSHQVPVYFRNRVWYGQNYNPISHVWKDYNRDRYFFKNDRNSNGENKKPLPNLSFKVMDMTELNLNQQFDLIIIPFNGFNLLNEFDQLKCLKKSNHFAIKLK